MRHNPIATVLMTRPRPAAESFVEQLSRFDLSFNVCFSPLIEIIPRAIGLDVADYPGVIFTSQQAVMFSPDGNGMTAYCVGDKTAALARTKGFDAISANGGAVDLIKMISSRAVGKKLLHIRGQHTRGNIAQNLSASGVLCDETVVYDQVELSLTDQAYALLKGGKPVILPLFSPRTAAILGAQVNLDANHTLVGMSENVLAVLRQNEGVKCYVSDAPTTDEMVKLVRVLLTT